MSFARWRHFIIARGSDCGYPRAVLSLEQGMTILLLHTISNLYIHYIQNGEFVPLVIRFVWVCPVIIRLLEIRLVSAFKAYPSTVFHSALFERFLCMHKTISDGHKRFILSLTLTKFPTKI